MHPRSIKGLAATLGLAIFLGITVMTLERVDRLVHTVESLQDSPFAVAEALLAALDRAYTSQKALQRAVHSQTADEARAAMDTHRDLERDIRRWLELVAERRASSARAIAPVASALADRTEISFEIAELLEAGRQAEARILLATRGETAAHDLHLALQGVLTAERGGLSRLREEMGLAASTAQRSLLILAIVAGGALAVAGIGAAFLLRTHRPLMRLRSTLLSLAEGHGGVEVPLRDTPGALGDMARAIQCFKDSLDQRDAADLARASSEESLKQSRQQLLVALQEAERADQAKTRFLAAANHDLRQPMQAIRLFLDVLDGRLTGARDRAVLEGALKALSAGEMLLGNYLDVAVLEAGMVTVEKQAQPVAELLASLTTELGPAAAAKGLEFTVVPCSAAIVSDGNLLGRLLRNLTANAIKYTERGRVLIGCRRMGRSIRIEVWDTGIGIPADEVTAVFEDFYQIANHERDRNKGLGLGLSVVARAARLLDHSVDVRSTLGRGSMFSVTVPQAAERPLAHSRHAA